MKIVLLGKPAAGKGTLAAEISRAYNLPIVSVGDILREHIKNGTEFGKTFKAYVNKGMLAPDEYVIEMVMSDMQKEEYKNGCILDGFSRTIEQAKLLKDVDMAIEISATDEQVLYGMSGRWNNKFTKGIWHESHKGFKLIKGLGLLEKRTDDNMESFKTRLALYNERAPEIAEFYKKQGKLFTIDNSLVWDKPALIKVVNDELVKRGLVKKKANLCERFIGSLAKMCKINDDKDRVKELS